MKKAVFFDIDGTLWDDHGIIPDSTKTAIRLLQEREIYTFICTGRVKSQLHFPVLHELGFDGIVGGCGTYVSLGEKEIFYRSIAPKRIRHTFEVLKKYRVPVVLEGKNNLYVTGEYFVDDASRSRLKMIAGEHFHSVVDYDMAWEISKFNIPVHNDNVKRAVAELSDWYDFLVHENVMVEGVPKGFSKASGIRFVCRQLGISRKDTYAFGDSANDIDMLEYVAHGIAMGNGQDKAKQAADYITTDIHDDGIYHACRYFSLI